MAPAAWALVLQVAAAGAPEPRAPGPEPLAYSLAGWADRVWDQITDRAGAIFGRLAREGIFQRYHPFQDHEYRLDEFTGAFHLGGEAAWHAAESGVRAWGASISNRDFINAAEAKLTLHLAGRLHSRFRLAQEETLEADRQRLLFTLDFDSLVAGWTPWFGMTLEFVKPDADLEFGARRTFGDRLRVSAVVALLDAFNDFNFVTLGVDSAETDFFREYLTHPIAIRYGIEWKPSRSWRVESHGATTNRAHLKGDLFDDGVGGFEQRERTRFLGVLGEWRPRSEVAVGGFLRIAEAEIRRTHAADDSAANFRLVERTRGGGLYVLFRPSTEWQAEATIFYTDRPERREGEAAIDRGDREWTAWVSLWRQLAGRVYFSVGYYYDDRSIDGDPVRAEALQATNRRLRTDVEFLFLRGARLAVGANWDMDFPGTASFFDGAHGRIVLSL
ncbi:MAG: hypothetical protein HY702_08735 [Gemmatimonadetes bacterium]|nr:hypothetical protein [Gemmatimonadota bacterium]